MIPEEIATMADSIQKSTGIERMNAIDLAIKLVADLREVGYTIRYEGEMP